MLTIYTVNNMKIGVILAGGRSSRFNSDLPKGLHKIDGKSIVERIMECFECAGVNKVFVVVNDDSYSYYIKENFKVDYLFQDKINGTGSAFYCFDGLYSDEDEVIVVNGDCFIYDRSVIKDFSDKCSLNNFNVGVVAREDKDIKGYGRIKVHNNKISIIEEKDLKDVDEDLSLINLGIYFFNGYFLKKYMKTLNNENKVNKITDLVDKEECYVYECESLILGVNNKGDFYRANKLYYLENCNKLLMLGVKIYDVNNTYIGENVRVGKDVEIYPNNYIFGDTVIGDSSVILPNCYIENSLIEKSCSIGPFSHLKNGSILCSGCVVGAFVEIKNSELQNNVKAKHHAYLADVTIGENSNVGCGVIVANYDGKNKNRSNVGKRCFIGSNSTLVSPVVIGDNVVIGAGSTIVKNINDNTLAIARERQINKENYYKNK